MQYQEAQWYSSWVTFASAAMQGFLATGVWGGNSEDLARCTKMAAEYADAMMFELGKR